jgi:hypothetical protein
MSGGIGWPVTGAGALALSPGFLPCRALFFSLDFLLLPIHPFLGEKMLRNDDR